MSKRDDALVLSEEILADFELGRNTPQAFIAKASRLARILNDVDAVLWLHYELSGYPRNQDGLDEFASKAAHRSNRGYEKDGKQYADTSTIGRLSATIEASKVQLGAASDAPFQYSTANPSPYQTTPSPRSNITERANLRNSIAASQETLDKVLGSVYSYVNRKYVELRFGSAVESAFDRVRDTVDTSIGKLIPKGQQILTTALENASTNNQQQWNNAAKACRDLIKAAADELRPPGPKKNGLDMSDSSYINRLVDWIQENSGSATLKDLIVADLQYFGQRIDAVADSGHKGTHTDVTKDEASRYIVSAYMLLGDILALHNIKTKKDKKTASKTDSKPKPKSNAKKPKKK